MYLNYCLHYYAQMMPVSYLTQKLKLSTSMLNAEFASLSM